MCLPLGVPLSCSPDYLFSKPVVVAYSFCPDFYVCPALVYMGGHKSEADINLPNNFAISGSRSKFETCHTGIQIGSEGRLLLCKVVRSSRSYDIAMTLTIYIPCEYNASRASTEIER